LNNEYIFIVSRKEERMENTKRKRVSILSIVLLLLLFLIACGNHEGDLNGYYVAEDELQALSGYSSFDFNDDQVTIGMIGGIMSYDTTYTYIPGNDGLSGTLSFELENVSFSLPCKMNGENLVINGVKYVKKS
jgi:hypothetical protein